jgi:putative ABC transport system permease protein
LGRHPGDFSGKRKVKVVRILRFLLSRDYYLERSGDLEEAFADLREESGPFRARAWLFFQIPKLCFGIFRMHIVWRSIMLKNYLKIAFRNMKRHKGYAFMNILGLAVGMACCILILLYVRYELSYDRYHTHADQTYRILLGREGFIDRPFAGSPPGLASALEENFPEVINATRVKNEVTSVRHKTRFFRENRFYFVDPDFLEIFNFPFLSGNPQTALDEPRSILLTSDMARKYFGDENPVGRVVSCNTFGQSVDYRVTGVLDNVPDNSHFHFDFLTPMSSLGVLRGEAYISSWNNNAFKTYLRIAEGSSPEGLGVKIEALLADKIPWKPDIALENIKNIHLFSKANPDMELEPNSDVRYIYFFSAIALFIMLIACFNYINLATAYSARRAMEIGIRKVVGAQTSQIVQQFFSEALLLSLMALLMAAMLAGLFLPTFRSLIGSEMNTPWTDLAVVAGVLGIMFFTGIVSGVYPALYLSSFRPIVVLKTRFRAGGKKRPFFRNTLVVFQFVISAALIVSTVAISKQLQYIQNRKIGFNKDYVLTALIGDQSLRKNNGPLKRELMNHPGILAVSTSSGLLTDIGWGVGPDWEGKPQDQNPMFFKIGVDFNYLDLYEMDVVAGRKFSREYATDKKEAVLLNETALGITGWENPIGKRFDDGTVVGVVKDFHFEPLREAIKPIFFRVMTDNDYSFFLSIKIKSENIPATLAYIDKTWKKFSPDYPFSYTFVDSAIDNLYRSEQRIGNAFKYFSLIAIFIACLGLFGLTSFTVEQRTKEIGIRKILGASIPKIMVMLSSDFAKLVLLANILAWPAAYYFVNRWLEGFAYRTALGPWIFLLTGIVTLIIAMVTIGLQSVKAATANPVDSLRYE